jgi:hypothetical protein
MMSIKVTRNYEHSVKVKLKLHDDLMDMVSKEFVAMWWPISSTKNILIVSERQFKPDGFVQIVMVLG